MSNKKNVDDVLVGDSPSGVRMKRAVFLLTIAISCIVALVIAIWSFTKGDRRLSSDIVVDGSFEKIASSTKPSEKERIHSSNDLDRVSDNLRSVGDIRDPSSSRDRVLKDIVDEKLPVGATSSPDGKVSYNSKQEGLDLNSGSARSSNIDRDLFGVNSAGVLSSQDVKEDGVGLGSSTPVSPKPVSPLKETGIASATRPSANLSPNLDIKSVKPSSSSNYQGSLPVTRAPRDEIEPGSSKKAVAEKTSPSVVGLSSPSTQSGSVANGKQQGLSNTDAKHAKIVDPKNGTLATKGHYLQVGVFLQEPNKSFLDTISRYRYRTQKHNSGGSVATKYLIGPYSSRTEANRDTQKVNMEFGRPVHFEVK